MAKKPQMNGRLKAEFEPSLLSALRPHAITMPGEKITAANKIFQLLMTNKRTLPDVSRPPTVLHSGEIAYLTTPEARRLIAILLETHQDALEILALYQEFGLGEFRDKLVIASGSVLTLQRDEQEHLGGKLWTITNENGTCIIS